MLKLPGIWIRNGLLRAAICLLALVVIAIPASAEIFFPGARPLAMGGANVSVATDNNAIAINPAGLNQISRYCIDLNYERREVLLSDIGNRDKKDIKDLWNLSIVDSKTLERLGAGLSVTSEGFPNNMFKKNQDYRIALGLGSDLFEIVRFGAAGKYMRFEKGKDSWNMDAGIMITATPWFHFGAAGYNLITPMDRPDAMRELTFGASLGILEYATVAFDTVYNWEADVKKRWNFHAGAEGVIAKVVALRGGYFFDEMHNGAGYYSAGVAYTSPQGGISYTFRGHVQQAKDFNHSIQVSIQF